MIEEENGDPSKKKSITVLKLQVALECFSIQKTMGKLFSSEKYAKEDSEFEVLNSIKVLSIALIVMGNTYFFIFNGPVRNLEAR